MCCSFWRLRALPVYKIGLPNLLAGNTDIFKPNHHLLLREAGKALGGIFKIRIFWVQVKTSSVALSIPINAMQEQDKLLLIKASLYLLRSFGKNSRDPTHLGVQ